ncbi:MAG: hypothetical protein JWP89_2910 [Schlesneria sp.]|nr:hypothetical protein [Schlesneria sp.]
MSASQNANATGMANVPMVMDMQLRVVSLIGIVVIASLAIAISLATLGPSMNPIRRGTSDDFWLIGANVKLTPNIDTVWGGDAYVIDETWAAYDENHMHGSHVYGVPLSEVNADLGVVVQKLEEDRRNEKNKVSVKGYLSWKELPQDRRDVRRLITSIARERKLRTAESDIDTVAFIGANEQLFQRRWRQADWYWADFVFEWIFLSGLVLFALWPGIRRFSSVGWGLHVACLPFLFRLPVYLGYAVMTLTSAGPSGGVLYPYLLLMFRGGSCTSFDERLLKYTPQILEPLSAPIGSPMALTGFGFLGPTSAIFHGLCYGGLLIAASYTCQYLAHRRHRFTSSSAQDVSHE